jgi:hypothetical protein
MLRFWWQQYISAFTSIVEGMGWNNMAAVIFTLGLFLGPLIRKSVVEGKGAIRKHWKEELRFGFLLTIGLWILCLFVYVSMSVPKAYSDLKTENTRMRAVEARKEEQHCWMQNITMFPNLKAVPAARSMNTVAQRGLRMMKRAAGSANVEWSM